MKNDYVYSSSPKNAGANLMPAIDSLIFDNTRHIYQVEHQGTMRKASYIANYDDFGSDDTIITVSYGLLLDAEPQYEFTMTIN